MAVSERFQGANVVDAGRLSPYWGEHAARYVYAIAFVSGKRVLDIACGTGYGIGLLRKHASFVVGVDIDASAAQEARKETGDNGSVMLADGLGLPFADGTFDVVTSFETLEHLHGRREFLAELRRVLTPGGELLLSTPNALYSKPVNGVPANPFHIHEYEPGELIVEIEASFEIESFVGQDLSGSIRISPFFEGQRRLPKDPATQIQLLGWKVLNKIPFAARERLSEAIWKKPFYPTETDYVFDQASTRSAPTLLVVARKSG